MTESMRAPDKPVVARGPRRVVELADAEMFVGKSAAMKHVVRRIEQFARVADFPIHFEGPTGVGKSMFAELLHRRSPRATRPYVTVDVGSIDDSLAASHLFGHERGSFTGAIAGRRGLFVEANGGTIFLDEIGKASLQVQQRLLSAVETKRALPVGADRSIQFDARVVSASNIALDRLILKGLFLPDLAARLRGMTIRIPPLSERRADIAELAVRFVAARSASAGYADPPEIHADLMEALVRARWPENVRQLHRTLHCLLIIAHPAPVLTLGHCEDEFSYLRGGTRTPRGSATVADVERAITETGSYEGAARQLGRSLASVYRILPASARRTGEFPAIPIRRVVEDEALP